MLRNLLPFTFFLPLIAMSQTNVTIHCTFQSSANDTVKVIPAQYFIEEYEKSYVAVTANDQCDFSFPVSKPTMAKLIFRQQSIPIYLEPGDEVIMNAGVGDSLYKAVTFSGNTQVHNDFLASFYQNFHSDFDEASINRDILSMDADAFEMKIFDERRKQLDFYNKSNDKSLFSDSFKKFMENMIRYHYYARLLSYP
ncbi:MAG: hypothetical protein ABIQ74_12600, partial [Chitinophagales bacterium]